MSKDIKNLYNCFIDHPSEIYKLSSGDECIFLPKHEWVANYCYVETLKKKRTKWIMCLRIENEFNNDSYIKKYKVYPNKKLKMNMLGPNLTFFLPPEKKTVLIKVLSISKDSISIRIMSTKK